MWNWLYHAERCQMPCYWLKLFLPCCIFRNLQFVSDLASSVARHSKNQVFSFTYWSSSSILLQTKFIVKLWPNPGQIIEKDQTIDKYILHYLLLLSISPISNLSFNRLSSSAASFFLLMVLSSTKEECFLRKCLHLAFQFGYHLLQVFLHKQRFDHLQRPYGELQISLQAQSTGVSWASVLHSP